jgi:hypothetical protein
MPRFSVRFLRTVRSRSRHGLSSTTPSPTTTNGVLADTSVQFCRQRPKRRDATEAPNQFVVSCRTRRPRRDRLPADDPSIAEQRRVQGAPGGPLRSSRRAPASRGPASRCVGPGKRNGQPCQVKGSRAPAADANTTVARVLALAHRKAARGSRSPIGAALALGSRQRLLREWRATQVDGPQRPTGFSCQSS